MINLPPAPDEAPLALHEETVIADWVDYNGHMNVAYYVLIFDHATDALLDHLKLDAKYREETANSVFVVESHINYEREVLKGTAVTITTQVLGADNKRLHIFHRMYEKGSDVIAATIEIMILHVNLTTRSVSPFPETEMNTINKQVRLHENLDKPTQAGLSIRELGRRQ